jgi:hypothetical protein
VRFDPVYVGHFKCNIRRIADYPNLSNYLRDLYQMPGIADTVNLFHIKQHYYRSHESVNPTRIVPVGPDLDYDAPHVSGLEDPARSAEAQGDEGRDCQQASPIGTSAVPKKAQRKPEIR